MDRQREGGKVSRRAGDEGKGATESYVGSGDDGGDDGDDERERGDDGAAEFDYGLD